MYTVSQKPTLPWLAITSTYTSSDFDNFWQECCQEGKKSNDTLFSYLT